MGNNRNNTCNGAYKGRLYVGDGTRGDDDIEKNLQKMIPDGWIKRFLLHSTRHRIASTTVKPLLSSKRWRPSQ